uniref:SCP domain-containing protein n=1 Tax=Leptobrachium leishanense TaxID=445787 RepID=A0A8C5MTG0_9ANUR
MDNLSLITCLCLILHQVHGYYKNDELNQQEIQTILDAHNHHMSLVSPSASDMHKMEWSDEAARNALAALRKCETDRKISQPFQARCGENLFMSSVDTDWWNIVKKWGSEKADFVSGETNRDEFQMVSHYSQLVWTATTKVGCARNFCHALLYPYYFLCLYCQP